MREEGLASSLPAFDSVLLNHRDGVLRIIKNNPDRHFGISLELWSELSAIFERLVPREDVRAVVIDAAGRGFHRGAVMVTELKPSLDQLTAADYRDLVQRGQALGRAIAASPKPVIGIVRAGALGGGLELLLRSDFLYTTDSAEFSFPEVTLGFVAAWGGTQWGGRMMPFRKAQELLLLSERISGRTAEEFGLVTRSFATEQALDKYVDRVCERLKFCSPAAFAQTKACLAATWAGPLELGERVELEAEAAAMGTGDYRKAYSAWASGAGFFNFADGTVASEIPSVSRT